MIQIDSINSGSRNFIISHIKENWGSTIVVTKGKVHDTEKLPGFIAKINGEIKGIITYNQDGCNCEIVTLDSMQENCGIGSSLIEVVKKEAQNNNSKRVWLITTNDNIHALRFYQKRGFDIVALYRNAVYESRKIKPQIPIKGFDDIPILHEIEFEKLL